MSIELIKAELFRAKDAAGVYYEWCIDHPGNDSFRVEYLKRRAYIEGLSKALELMAYSQKSLCEPETPDPKSFSA